MKESKSLKEIAYDNCFLLITDMEIESEGKEYKACQFKVNNMNVICRSAKITPKKIGQFVTFWRRDENGVTEPFHEPDDIDFYVVNVNSQDRMGQFVFPRSVLIEKRIMTSGKYDGKRGFRLYPNWDSPKSKQAIKTQKWQANYFIQFDNDLDLEELKKLYEVI